MGPNIILKVLVGSRAYGLERGDSDYDSVCILLVPTRSLLAVKRDDVRSIARHTEHGDQDTVYYELGHFLYLATKCNPTVLQVFKAPVLDKTDVGDAVLSLFPHVL